MKNPTFKALSLLSFLSLAIILAFSTFLASKANAHEVIGANGQPTHSHVYKKAANGSVIAGHSARPPGSNGVVIWQSAPSKSYANAQSGMNIPRNAWSKKARKQTPKKKKPVFTKGQNKKPVLKPQ